LKFVVYWSIVVILQMDSLESQLRMWRYHSEMFISCASRTLTGSDAQQAQLRSHCESARDSVVR